MEYQIKTLTLPLDLIKTEKYYPTKMKKHSSLIILLLMAVFMSSCVSTKKIVYFQGADKVFEQAQQIMQQYEMKLKPADQVIIKVSCSEPELLSIFAQDVTMGTAGTNNSYSMQSTGSMTNVYGYTVTNDGYLVLPAVGKVRVEGFTSDEAAVIIANKIRETNLIKDPEVTVRLLNARVAVLGAVKTPKVVSLTSERNTILDVLSNCGDIADTGLRQKIKLFREVNGQRMMYDIDLTKTDLFNNPAYYVQQNDLIYVEPNKSQSIKSSAFYTFLSAGSSILSVISAIISIVVIATKK